jgi:hypothetical protein
LVRERELGTLDAVPVTIPDGAHDVPIVLLSNFPSRRGDIGNCETADLVTNYDFLHGEVIWDDPQLYWGYPPPKR